MAPPEHPSSTFGVQPNSIYDLVGYHQAPPPPKQAEQPVHTGPNGIPLRGFGVYELNRFHYEVAETVQLPPHDPVAIANTKHTTQGVDAEPLTIIQGPQDWKAADFKGPENAHKWQYHLTAQDISEIEAALAGLKEKGIRIEDITRADFPLPTLGPKLEWVRDEIILGKGFHVIKGFPVDKFDRWQTVATYYAFGLYWGKPQAQNAKGHIVGHIAAIGTDPHLPGVRPYTTNIPHGVHSDNSDIVGLLCIRDAEEGGVTLWASSIAVHNELLRRGRKDLVEALTNGEFWLPAHNVWGSPKDKWEQGEAPGEEWVNTPPFIYHKNRLNVTFKEGAFYYRYKFPGAPRFTPLEEEALRTFTALALSDDLRLDFKLQPGDIGLVNNLTMLHAKTAFKDSNEPGKRRHLLRLWVAAENAPELPTDRGGFLKTWGSVDVGSRGGYWLGHNYVKHAPLYAEYGDLEETRPKEAIVL